MKQKAFMLIVLSLLMGCVGLSPTINNDLEVPTQLAGKVTVVDPFDPDYARAAFQKAKNEPGKGGISDGLVVKTKVDLAIYRLWSGPGKIDDYGNTNRYGSWWSYVPLKGSAKAYRLNNAVCKKWNDLTWVAQCTLKAGSVVAIGPGQSVFEKTCSPGDEKEPEAYSSQPSVWQMYIDSPLYRRTELQCPKYKDSDYEANEEDISLRKYAN